MPEPMTIGDAIKATLEVIASAWKHGAPKRSTIPATAVNQLIETSVRNADRLLSQMLLLCPISGSSRLVLSTTQLAGS
jgi:hypothetical protein